MRREKLGARDLGPALRFGGGSNIPSTVTIPCWYPPGLSKTSQPTQDYIIVLQPENPAVQGRDEGLPEGRRWFWT
jgi:hypothetical protein